MRLTNITRYLLPQNKSCPSTKSQDKPCKPGLKKETFSIESLQMEDTSITETKCKKFLKQALGKKRPRESKSVTPECLQPSRKKTCKDKSKNSKKRTHITPCTKTLGADSTGKEKTFSGSWLKSVQGWSQRLWLCTETDYVDMDLSSFNSYANSFKQNCWFTVETKKRIHTSPVNKNCPKTCSPSSTYSWQETMENVLLKTKKEEMEKENMKKKKRVQVKAKAKNQKTIKEPAQRTWKVRLYPNKEQREKLNKMIGTYRYIYNQCVDYYNNGVGEIPTIKELRDKFVCVESMKQYKNQWPECLPWDSRDEACRDFIAALKINWKVYDEKVEKKTFELTGQGLNQTQAKQQAIKIINIFKMRFKSKKRKKIQSFFIRERHWNQKTGGVSWMKEIKTKESFDIRYDTRVLKDGVGKYFILVLKPLEPIKAEERRKIISIDPGERTFLTCYDPEGKIFEFGKNDSDSLIKLGMKADKLQSLHDKKQNNESLRFNSKKRKNLKKKFQKIKYKIQNKVKDCHHKISKYLVQSYDNILLPSFSTSGMIKKEDRRIGSKTVRKLLTWSHYKFHQIIQSKSKRFGAFVIPCEEHYTSKGCGYCGDINNELGESKGFECPKCKFKSDRDINASRNILLKYFIENS